MQHDEINIPSEELELPSSGVWANLPWIGLALGLAGFGLTAFLGKGHLQETLYSYTFAYIYFVTFALGGLFFSLLQYLTRAGWSVVVRRLAECVMATMPLFIVLMMPIAIWHSEIFLWANPAAVDTEAFPHGPHLLEHKESYLNSGFFLFRAFLFLGLWSALGWYFLRHSRAQDKSGDIEITRRLQSRSAAGMCIFALSVNFAAFDWVMSLDPFWFSTIFGVYIFAGSVIAIMCTLILISLQLQASGRLKSVITWEHYHDLGKLLFAFTVFWAYIGFSQFMLIWYGNIPEETTFFFHRQHHGWETVTQALVIGHFAIPFLYLLSSDVKRRRLTLTIAALWMLFMHMVDIYWLVMPNIALFDPNGGHGFHPSLTDLTSLVGIGGLFLAALGWNLKGGSLLPVKDPRLGESMAFENM